MKNKPKKSIRFYAFTIAVSISIIFFIVMTLLVYLDTKTLIKTDPLYVDDPLSNLTYLFIAIWGFMIFVGSFPVI